MVFRFDGEDLPPVFFPALNHLLHFFAGVRLFEFAHVCKTMDVLIEIDECTEVIDLVYGPGYDVANVIFFMYLRPRVDLEGLHGE